MDGGAAKLSQPPGIESSKTASTSTEDFKKNGFTQRQQVCLTNYICDRLFIEFAVDLILGKQKFIHRTDRNPVHFHPINEPT
jgi:hypothetical protein